MVLLALVVALGLYIGFTIYKIDRAVHHVAVAPALLAKGQNDLLVVVQGPRGSEQVYVFRTTPSHTRVLTIPSSLSVESRSGHSVPLSHLDPRKPSAIIEGLRHVGIPVGHYVGVDLRSVSPTSALAELASGTISMSSLIAHPAGTASLLEAVASHVYLGPDTAVSALLTLMRVPVGPSTLVPTSIDRDGRVVLAGPAAGVLRRFL